MSAFAHVTLQQLTPKMNDMATIMSLGFEYKGKEYYSLIRVKERNENTEYHITVMNGELERLLYGNHILNLVNGSLRLDDLSDNSEQCRLKRQIAEALDKHLHQFS